MSDSRDTGFSPALIGSVVLHGAVAAAILVGWPWKTPIPITLGESVPVTIVTEGPTNVRPAEEAPVEQTAQTEDPVPQASPQPPAPVPAAHRRPGRKAASGSRSAPGAKSRSTAPRPAPRPR